MIKLIASDLDGTLLQDGTQELTPRAISLIHSLTQKGIHFVAASGRQYTNERIVFDKIKDEISYIGENGSICMHQGKLIFRGTIRDDLAYRIIREVKKSDHFEIIVSREDTCLIEDRNPEFVDHIVNIMHNKTEIVEDLNQINGPFLKIAICNMIDSPEVLTAYLKHLQSIFGSEIKIVTSGNIWIDFIAPGTNKGTALEHLLKVLDITPEECIAFGDQYNDIEMLELVGTGYAMTNAAPGVADHADAVTSSVEDVLEKILLDVNL